MEQASVYAENPGALEKLTKKGDWLLTHVSAWPKMIANTASLQPGSRWRVIAAPSDAQDAAVAYMGSRS